MGPNFSIQEIQGQKRALVYLQRYLENPNLLPPLLIFYGPEGTGKEAATERFIRQLLCLEGTSCGVCASCKAFMHHAHPDIVWFPSDKNKTIPIGTEDNPEEFSIRWLIRSRLYYRPHLSKVRFIIIPDAKLIGNEAETALLKSLEEAPSFTRFIFLVDDLESLKETITSRAVCIPFDYLPQEIVKDLHRSQGRMYHAFQGGSMETYDCPKEALELILSKVTDKVETPLDILHLEEWALNYKDDHPEWKDGFSFKDFLDLLSLVLIQEYTKNSYELNIPKIEQIFAFKETLHERIHGQESIIFSKLVNSLTLLSHK
ncbi:hypothetical protein CH373_00705 [Leptospira perolatii]|uniref:DNA polymerase III subunit delta n=1 Tax=Leptospira perolatii TaxID=2023191 RepID=A0A2M9ZR98_9LEPT|nr:hypothetical protein [Leptospira perolatii]PJZ71076.1 hypothetical protein CH360_00705 [Leptospira perolatii]PJZ74608.1 hypothetical protein CH373_00705 [Leptospira perolatii]